MEAIKDRLRRVNAALNAYDLNGLGKMYAEHAELRWPGLPTIKGRRAAIAFSASSVAQGGDIR
jgi:hypothetical protein